MTSPYGSGLTVPVIILVVSLFGSVYVHCIPGALADGAGKRIEIPLSVFTGSCGGIGPWSVPVSFFIVSGT
jgi:hypothetical protein